MKIIAEIGLNHCGSEKRAEELLQRLVKTRVDAITFQIREKEFYDHTHPRKYELSNQFFTRKRSSEASDERPDSKDGSEFSP